MVSQSCLCETRPCEYGPGRGDQRVTRVGCPLGLRAATVRHHQLCLSYALAAWNRESCDHRLSEYSEKTSIVLSRLLVSSIGC
jgi:hypothetical protein